MPRSTTGEFNACVLMDVCQHFGRVVDKVQHIGGGFAGVGAVQAAQGLHRLNAGQAFVHVHAAQQRLVEPGLELVGHQQQLIFPSRERPDVRRFRSRS